MRLRILVLFFLVVWVLWCLGTLWWFGDWSEQAGWFGDSFGGVSALFSGLALALAIYSMLLQQKQASQFEQVTLDTLARQSQAISLIEKSLVAQANPWRVSALTSLIALEDQRIEMLRTWGRDAGDEHKYANGIRAAQSRLERYQEQIRAYASS